jgi:hypothetical protein
MPSAILIQVGFLVLVCCMCLVYWVSARATRARRSQLQQVRERCVATPDNATIFVLLVTRGQAQVDAAARAIHSVFDRATCPFRIVVGVHETYDTPSSLSVLERYAQLAPSGTFGRSFADHVTVLRTPPHRARGVHAARAELMARAYTDQAFVLIISDAVELENDWDTRAIAALAACRDPHAMLVAPPAATHHALFSETRKNPQDQHKHKSNGNGNSPRKRQHPRFPVLERFSKAGVPVPGSRVFGRPGPEDSVTTAPTPVLFWMGDCVFSPARAYIEHGIGVDSGVPPHPTPFDETLVHLTTGEDGIMSARLWTSGWMFYTPQFVLASYQAGHGGSGGSVNKTLQEHKTAALADPIQRKKAEATHEAVRLVMGGKLGPGENPVLLFARGLGTLRTLKQWEAFCGLDISRRFIAGRARMGATPTPDAHEVRAKYDSFQSYDAEKSLYK